MSFAVDTSVDSRAGLDLSAMPGTVDPTLATGATGSLGSGFFLGRFSGSVISGVARVTRVPPVPPVVFTLLRWPVGSTL